MAYESFYFSNNEDRCIINIDTPSDSSPVPSHAAPINAGKMEIDPLPGDTANQRNKIHNREQEALKEQKEKEQKESKVLLGDDNINSDIQEDFLMTASDPYKDNTYQFEKIVNYCFDSLDFVLKVRYQYCP